jgi:hypothetical protein
VPRIAYLESIRGLAAVQVLLLHFLAAFAPDLVYGAAGRGADRGHDSSVAALLLPALACALALFLTFTFTGEPTGFAINLIVGALVLRRAGPWWRRAPVPALAVAGA